MTPSIDVVKSYLHQYFQPQIDALGLGAPTDEMNLVESGLIDSFGLMTLVQTVEEHFSVEVDLSEVDIEDFTTFAGFVRAVVGTGAE